MLLIFSLNACIQGILAIVFRANPLIGEVSGVVTSLNSYPIMFCGLLGMHFFTRGTGWAGTASEWLIPSGEFLLTRPISRRTSYFSLMFLYFIVLLSPCALDIVVTMVEPDLRVSFYHGKTQSTEGADKLSLYQVQFPNSSLIRMPKEGHDTLIISFGAVLPPLAMLACDCFGVGLASGHALAASFQNSNRPFHGPMHRSDVYPYLSSFGGPHGVAGKFLFLFRASRGADRASHPGCFFPCPAHGPETN